MYLLGSPFSVSVRRGDPPPQSPASVWNVADRCWIDESVVPAGAAIATPPASSVVAAVDASETILTPVASCVAEPKSVTPVSANAGAATKSATAHAATKSISRFIHQPP